MQVSVSEELTPAAISRSCPGVGMVTMGKTCTGVCVAASFARQVHVCHHVHKTQVFVPPPKGSPVKRI